MTQRCRAHKKEGISGWYVSKSMWDRGATGESCPPDSIAPFPWSPVAGVSIVKDSKKSHKRLKKPSNIDNSLYPLFQTLIFCLCYCFLRLYILTDNEGEWSNDRNRDFFCHPKEVTFPSIQK